MCVCVLRALHVAKIACTDHCSWLRQVRGGGGLGWGVLVRLLLSWRMTALPLCMQHVKLRTVWRWKMRAPPSGPATVQRRQITEEYFALLDIPSAASRDDTSTSIHGDRNCGAEILPPSSAPLSQLKKTVDEAKFDPIDSLYWTYRDPAHWVDLDWFISLEMQLLLFFFTTETRENHIRWTVVSQRLVWVPINHRNFTISTLEIPPYTSCKLFCRYKSEKAAPR